MRRCVSAEGTDLWLIACVAAAVMQTLAVAVHRRRVRFDPDPELARPREVSPVVRHRQ